MSCSHCGINVLLACDLGFCNQLAVRRVDYVERLARLGIDVLHDGVHVRHATGAVASSCIAYLVVDEESSLDRETQFELCGHVESDGWVGCKQVVGVRGALYSCGRLSRRDFGPNMVGIAHLHHINPALLGYDPSAK